jgi:RHS repeat-associated protein
VVQELSYDPWGRLRNPTNQELYAVGAEPAPFLGRGYTGHEHLTIFGLINMNARLYDPAVGRFLSPDPYVQSPDFSQNFNRYSYCLNNPLKYTDQSGEFWNIIIGAVIGGVGNWIAHGCKFSWEGLPYFGAGAVAGVATALSPGSFIAISAGLSGANSIIGQGFNNGWKNIDFGQVAGSAIMGGVTSYAGGLMGSAMHLDKLLNGISSPLLQKGLQGVIGGAVIGSTFGGMSAVANGHNFFDGAWSGAKMGLVTGAISGLGSAVQYSTKNNVDLLTGKPIWPKNNGALGYEKITTLPVGTKIDRYGSEKGSYFAPEGTPFENRSLPAEYKNLPLNTYEVTRPLPIWESTTAPRFNQPGLGTQYRHFYNVEFLKYNNWIK